MFEVEDSSRRRKRSGRQQASPIKGNHRAVAGVAGFFLTLLIVAFNFVSCERPDPFGLRNPEKDPYTIEMPDPASRQEWQLHDDAAFYATIDPWPPRPGNVTVKAWVTPDDADQKFEGTVFYRVLESQHQDLPWIPIPSRGPDQSDSIQFFADATLKPGPNYIEFKVHSRFERKPIELTDWKVFVR